MKVNLIGDVGIEKELNTLPINFIRTSDFYDNSDFLRISQNLNNSLSFRNGFWLKTLERFFVLEQFMKKYDVNSLLHAELDQLLFGLEELEEVLRTQNRDGLYIPMHKMEAAIASLIYIQNSKTLSSLLNFAQSSIFPNEMKLIADWGNKHPDQIFGLPTLASELIPYSELNNIKILNANTVKGIVDGAQLGQWVAGIDPKNVPIRNRPTNMFVESSNPLMLDGVHMSNLRFLLDEEGKKLQVRYLEEPPYRLYNLHLHSKVHQNLLNLNPSVAHLIEEINNLEVVEFKGTRRIQIFYYLSLRFGNFLEDPQRIISRFTRSLNLKLGLRGSSKPYISGDSFRKEANLVWERSSSKFEVRDVKSDFVIFCESDCISDLNEKILKKLTVPITLILGNSDQNHGYTFQNIKNSVGVKKIFAQNLETSMDGFYPLPIGLENLWRASHGKTSAFKKLRKVSKIRKPRIMWTFTIDTNPAVRSKAAQELSIVEVADRFGTMSSKEHRELLLSYSFVASPPGNGLDTHRAWEAMYLGCVPIVLRSYMTEYFEKLGLPIWVVDCYSQIESLSEQQLSEKYEKLQPGFKSKALWFDFWVNQINS
jgi:hypothetical protein